MTLKRYANFEEKIAYGLKKDLRNMANRFIQSRKGITLKFAEKLCVMTMRIMRNLKRN